MPDLWLVALLAQEVGMIIRSQQMIRVEGGQNVFGSVCGSGETKFLAPNILNISSGEDLHIPPPAIGDELILELTIATPAGSLIRLGHVRRPALDADTSQLRFW